MLSAYLAGAAGSATHPGGHGGGVLVFGFFMSLCSFFGAAGLSQLQFCAAPVLAGAAAAKGAAAADVTPEYTTAPGSPIMSAAP